MKLRALSRAATAILAAIAATVAAPLGAVDRPNFNRSYDQPAAAIAAGVQAPGAVASRDGENGPARFVWSAGKNLRAAAGSTPEQAARFYLRQHAAHYGVGEDSLATVELTRIHDTGRGGILAIFGQKVAGIPVANARVSVMMQRDLALVALGGAIVPATAVSKGTDVDSEFRYGAEDALDAAFFDLFDQDSVGSWERGADKNGALVYRLSQTAESATQVSLWAPSRAWRVWFATPDGLVPAWKVEILATEAAGDASFEHVVSAADGSLLARRNLTASAEAPEGTTPYNYTVWAQTAGLKTPFDGPIEDVTPHPTGLPDPIDPDFVPPVVVTENSLNMFGDPWLPNAATTSTGNNVDAYADLVAPDGFNDGDMRAEVTGGDDLAYVYDTEVGAAANPTQVKGAIVNLFYINNWLHDYYYDSGFDEVAGNAQTDNYGRGGAGGDSIKAESDDVGGTNNANMSTPADGEQPRMQMFKWTGAGDSTNEITQTSPPGPTFVAMPAAGFGPQGFDITDDLIIATDASTDVVPPSTGTGTLTDGCQPPIQDVTGKIVIVDRGACLFVWKAHIAQQAGAVGIIISNNQAGIPPMGGTCADANVPPFTIPPAECAAIGPAFGVSTADGTSLKTNALAVRMHSVPVALRSGSLDAQIVAHEWGHYLHHRLQNCGTQQCGAQSEGWGDYNALHMTVEEGDSGGAYNGVYGAAIYSTASFDPAYVYFGIRRFPYSSNFAKNALTFKHISDGQALPPTPVLPNGLPNSEVHNAGEIWATMMFEAYLRLLTDQAFAPSGLTRLSFLEAKRRITDYVVAGLQMTPVDSTFTETRDGILAAAYAGDPLDFQAIAEAFATRGAGTCAIGPPRESLNLTGVTESFTLGGRLTVTDSPFADDVTSCDDDGYLDATETGTLTIEVTNLGPSVLNGATVSVASDNAHVTFPGGNSEILGSLAFGDADSVSFQVAADGTTVALSSVNLTVTVTHAQTCTGSTQFVKNLLLAADEFATGIDDVEAQSTEWSLTGDAALWNRVFASGNTVWHGTDTGSPTDTQLVSPAMTVQGTGNFILEFDHRYQFEADTTLWDGGVIEFSTDGGGSWADLETLGVDVPYDGVLTSESGNPLGGREAFSGENPAYPAMNHLSFNLGTQLAGDTVRFRFRIGTDASVGAAGWDIDNIAVTNVTTAPFTTIGPDASCASSLIFRDGFASGNTFAWSAQVP